MPLIKGLAKASKQQVGPVWTGPSGDGPNGGITYSALCRFLTCRERFRIHMVEGLRPVERFSHRLEYGNMWHVCEEALASEKRHFGEVVGTTLREDILKKYAQQLCRRFPYHQEEVEKWYSCCRVQFPEYVKYWSKHPDVANRTPLLSEQTFDVPYHLPSGRTVRLRGKWDSVDLVDGKVWLQENKSKSEVDGDLIQRQLRFDLQTMAYLVALEQTWKGNCPMEALGSKIAGVRYNVVRRPLSGGKGTIVRSKGTQGSKCPKCKGVPIYCPKCNGTGRVGGKPEETKEDYYERLRQYIAAEPETYFFRWRVEVSPADVARFRRQCLDPILEQLCDWWEFIAAAGSNPWVFDKGEYHAAHYRFPYGVWNPLTDGNGTDLDHLLDEGSTVGLAKVENLFPEL